MPYRTGFDCLWCGRPHTTRGPEDLEGWALLCPDCVGRAGENGFLRFRLKAALAERARAQAAQGAVPEVAHPTSPQTVPQTAPVQPPPTSARPTPTPAPAAPARTLAEPAAMSAPGVLDAEMVAYYAARAPEYDDWYLRRGRYSHGAIHDMAWQVDLDTVTRWLDAQPLSGEIVELAAGTGWWSPLLAQKGELWAYDATPEPLDRARERLLAHGLRAHLHVRDAWAEPDRVVDAVFAGFWLSHVPRARLDAFFALVRGWLRPGGAFLFVDSLDDPRSGAADHDRRPVAPDVQMRRVADGREFRVVKVFHEPAELGAALERSGFTTADVGRTSRFFLYGRAVAP